MIDTAHIDLKVLIEQHASLTFARIANSQGGEYASACPFCESTVHSAGTGRDRFRVWPYHSERPHYWCRACRRSGDAIQFLIDYENLTFKQALVELEFAEMEYIAPAQHFYDDPPSPAWQAAASDFIQRAERYLWLPGGQKALEYLRGRGFTDETIKSARLGYVPLARDGRWFTAPLESWGLSQEQTSKDVVRIADGIVIPWISGDDVWKICIKRPWADPKTELVYGQVVGSGEGLYCADSILPLKSLNPAFPDQPPMPVMMVEGEFDCLSVLQETKFNIACVATGSASRGRTQRWIELLNTASLVLQSFDNDPAGDDGAQFWLETIPNAIRWKPWKKDANDMLQRGQPIASWVELGLQSAQFAPEKAVASPVSAQPVNTSSYSLEPLDAFPEQPLPIVEGFCIWHKKKPAYEQDTTGKYCKRCWDERRVHQNQTIERADKLGFPPFLDISSGEIAWVEFVLEADDIKLGSVEGLLHAEIQGLRAHLSQ